ncbi:MAG: HAD hydrolase-like protein [Opitutales bacterium]
MTLRFIFDFDGVLCDSEEHAFEVLNYLAPIHRYQVAVDREELRRLSARQIMDICGVPLWKVPIISWHACFVSRNRGPDMELFPEVVTVLKELLKENFDIHIVTSNGARYVKSIMQRYELPIRRLIPHTNMLGKARHIKKLMRSFPENDPVIYIGDQVADIEAAQKAGCLSGAVAWGFNHPDLLKTTSPDHFFESPEEWRDLFFEKSGK